MLRKLSVALALVLAFFVGVGLSLPGQYHVERSVVVARPAATLFTLLNGYRNFNEWSPWADLDPGATYSITGPPTGVGARLSWSGDPRMVGTGWQEITLARPFERIEMHLNLAAEGEADSYFAIRGDGASSRVTWGFDTDVTAGRGFAGALLARYFGLFLERWVGSDFETGLARFKRYAESLPVTDFSAADIRVLDVEPVAIIFVAGSSSQDAASVAEALGQAYAELTTFLATSDVQLAGEPMAITREWDETGFRFHAALPVDRLPESPPGSIRTGFSPGGRAVRIVHLGPYHTILSTYEQLAAYMAAHGLQEGAVSWEHYVSDPGNTPPEELVTHIYFQVGD